MFGKSNCFVGLKSSRSSQIFNKFNALERLSIWIVRAEFCFSFLDFWFRVRRVVLVFLCLFAAYLDVN